MLKEDEECHTRARYLIDATPDLRYQIQGRYLDGIFLSHEGLGHMTGLLFLGKESYDYSGIPVYTSEAANDFMDQNDPYRFLKDRDNIDVREIEDGDEQNIQGGKIEIVEVEHPQVETDNFCFMIHGENKKIFYISDINRWSPKTEELVREADIAIVDGTFWSADEIDRYEEVPHPTIQETMDEFEDSGTEIYFTHMNHTNPVFRKDSEERKEMNNRNYWIVEQGQEFDI
jgi:pyrroloquinoline quinone biosynthesis protein B